MLIHEGHASASRFFTPANAGSYDSVVRLTTFGRDSVWKHEIIRAVGPRSTVLELASGTGVLSSMLARSGKNVTGIDFTFEYLRASKNKRHTDIAQGTAEILPYRSELFDAVVSSYLAKYVNVQQVINECWRVLRPGGIAVFHDFTYPKGAIRVLWNTHFALLRATGRLIPSWRQVFEQLDSVIKNSDWASQITRILQSRGFQKVERKYYTAGTAAIVSAEKP